MYRLIWSVRAEKDYYETLIFWTKHNKSNSFSKKLIAEVENKLKYILQNPNSGLITDFYKTYKVQILKYYSIYYQISENDVEILSFWDNRRNPENLEI